MTENRLLLQIFIVRAARHHLGGINVALLAVVIELFPRLNAFFGFCLVRSAKNLVIVAPRLSLSDAPLL